MRVPSKERKLQSSCTVSSECRLARPKVAGKFLYVGQEKLWVRGVTYGAFRPDARGNEYHDLKIIRRDFAQMAASGLNAVRIPHTMPPRSLLDAAQEHGLRVMVGLSAEQYVGFLIDKKKAPDIEHCVRDQCAYLRWTSGPSLLRARQRDPGVPGPLARAPPGRAVPRATILGCQRRGS